MPASGKDRVTLSDIAAAADISVPAASMALANHPDISLRTRRKVLEISRRLGYKRRKGRVSRQVVTRRRPQRLSFIALGSNLSRPVIANCLMQVIGFGSRAGVRLEAACIENVANTRSVVDQLLNIADPHEGVILTDHVESAVMEAMEKEGIPYVVLGDPIGPDRGNIVTFDHEAAGRRLTAHLLARGHRRIAFVCDTLHPHASNTRWLDGYRLAHLDVGAALDPDLVMVSNQVDAGGADRLLRSLDGAGAPTAAVSVNWPQTSSILHELARSARTLEVGILCVDELADPVTAGLPRVDYNLHDLCETAMQRLLALCDSSAGPAVKTLVPFKTANLALPA